MFGDFGIEVFYGYLLPASITAMFVAIVYLVLRFTGSRFERLYAYLLEDDGRRLSRLAFVVFAGVFLFGFSWIIIHRYSPVLNESDAGTMNQALYSATHGHLFSDSMMYTANGIYKFKSSYYYGSIIATNLYFVPLCVISWVYLLWPESPMQILIPYVLVMLVGGASFYFVARMVTGRRATAAYLLMLYALLPQMHLLSLVTKGAFDIYSGPFLLWALFFLYRRNFLWFASFAVPAFFVSIFPQYITIVLALGGYWLYREKKYLFLAVVLTALNLATYATFDAARFCMSTMTESTAHRLADYVLVDNQELAIRLLRESFSMATFIIYICPLLIFAFFRNRFSMVLLAALAPVCVMTALRDGNIASHHNADVLIILLFLYAVYLKDGFSEKIQKIQAGRLAAAQLAVFFAVPFFIVTLSANKYAAFMMNRQLYGVVTVTPRFKYNHSMDGGFREVRKAVNRVIPKDASLCVLTELGNEAIFSNRHSIWFINEVKTPACQFYVLQNDIDVFNNPYYNGNNIPVASLSKIWGNDLYAIYRNSNPEDIPYPHWVMGFNYLQNFRRTECPNNAQSILPRLANP